MSAETHVLFLGGGEGGFQRGGEVGLSPKREFHLKWKNDM